MPLFSSSAKLSFVLSLLVLLAVNVKSAECQIKANTPADSLDGEISAYVRRVFQDREGRYWFGTNDDGVALYDGKSLRRLARSDGLAGNAVRGMVQDQSGAMWFATDNGVSRYRNGQFETFTTANGLSHNDTWSIALDQTQTIWVGTKRGICRWTNGGFEPFELPSTSINAPESRIAPSLAWTIFVDRKGVVWIGSDGLGVFRFDGRKTISLTQSDGLLGNQVSSITEGHDGRMWFGFLSGGVCSFDGEQFQAYGKDSGLPGEWVWTMYTTRSGQLYVSVLGAGLYSFNGQAFASSKANQLGLPNQVQSLMEDADGDLWLGCSGGLFRIESERLIHVTKSGPWQNSIESSNEHGPLQPLQRFEKLISDAWVVTANSGTKMVHIWKWGPGKASIERWTEGLGAGGEPWKELAVYYWNPRDNRIHVFGVSPFDSGINEGTIEFDGESATIDSTLKQGRGPRFMQTRWSFKNSKHYTETLLERDSSGKLFELVAFDHHRVPLADVHVHIPAGPSEGPTHTEGLKTLLDKPWRSEIAGAPSNYQWSLAWIPVAKYYYGTVKRTDLDNAADLAHFFLYGGDDVKPWRFLALCANSDMMTGEIQISPDGNLKLVMQHSTSSTTKHFQSTIELTSSELILRQQVQTADQTSPRESFSIVHRR